MINIELDYWMLNELIEILYAEKQKRIKPYLPAAPTPSKISLQALKVMGPVTIEKAEVLIDEKEKSRQKTFQTYIEFMSSNRYTDVGRVSLIEKIFIETRDKINEEFFATQTKLSERSV